MIYNTIIPDALEQGDICFNLPKISSAQINFSDKEKDWLHNLKLFEDNKIPDEPIIFNASPVKANGVVLSQSCDIRLGSSILFAELKERKEHFLESTKRRIKQIKKIINDETRFHYFPPDSSISIFGDPKILDFKSLFLIPYDFLKANLKNFFVARLIPDARIVLCEKISKFFTRLAFENAMYFTNEEIEEYLKDMSKEDIESINRVLLKLNRGYIVK